MRNFIVAKRSEPIISSTIFHIRDADSQLSTCRVINYPTGNCQTFMIAHLNSVFYYTNDHNNATEVIRAIRDVCGIQEKLCQVDIRRELFDKIKDYITIHASMEYINLTGNKMVNLLIKL